MRVHIKKLISIFLMCVMLSQSIVYAEEPMVSEIIMGEPNFEEFSASEGLEPHIDETNLEDFEEEVTEPNIDDTQ